MDQNIKKLWIAKLRSGEIQQTKHALKNVEGMCCMGVLCELHRNMTNGPDWYTDTAFHTYMDEQIVLPLQVQKWAGLNNYNPEVGHYALGAHNDGDKSRNIEPKTFAEIADLIEAETHL